MTVRTQCRTNKCTHYFQRLGRQGWHSPQHCIGVVCCSSLSVNEKKTRWYNEICNILETNAKVSAYGNKKFPDQQGRNFDRTNYCEVSDRVRKLNEKETPTIG